MESFVENNKKYIQLSTINFARIRKNVLLLYDITGRCIGTLDEITLCQDCKPHHVTTYHYSHNWKDHWNAWQLYIEEKDIIKGQ